MPADPQATLHRILELLGFPATVEEHRMEEGILLDVMTEDSGRLIGRQGQTLADLQYITNRILFQQDPSVPKALVDIGGYRAQAREALVKKAQEAAEKVRRWADVVELNSYHVGLRAQAEILIAIAGEFLSDPYPAWTAVGVTELFDEEAVVEISCVAAV